ncbi:MAG: endoglucanase [Frankiales bacterium]|nr:endoglucanase [Frankiales bacterium]
MGEVGWPDGPNAKQWEAVASTWYDDAVSAGIGTYAWAAAEQWPPSYRLAIYRSHAPGAAGARLDLAGPQARLVTHYPSDDGTLRGVALADGSFGASLADNARYSSQHPGTYGADYRYPSAASLQYLHAQGVRSVRVAFQWERLQPHPSGPLSQVELARLREVLTSAATAGLKVVLDLHNYGRFAGMGPDGRRRVLVLGSPQLPAAALADLWRRLAAGVSGAPALGGYGLMNEPHDLPGGARAWERASQLALVALRVVDRTTPVLVAGYASSGAASWASQHPQPWLPAAAGPVLYEAHQYFDHDGSGTYARSFAAEQAEATRQGWARCPSD